MAALAPVNSMLALKEPVRDLGPIGGSNAANLSAKILNEMPYKRPCVFSVILPPGTKGFLDTRRSRQIIFGYHRTPSRCFPIAIPCGVLSDVIVNFLCLGRDSKGPPGRRRFYLFSATEQSRW